MAIDTGDIVKHEPTGETWTVAFVDNDRLWWCGWPEGTASLADCVLVKKASAAERHKLLVDMSKSDGARSRYAQRQLETI